MDSVVFFGFLYPDYPRENVLRRAFESNGVTVRDCALTRAEGRLAQLIVSLVQCLTLLYSFRAYRDSDYILVPKNNELVIPIAKVLSLTYGIPLVFDIFDPPTETAAMKGQPLRVRVAMSILERMSVVLADVFLVTSEGFKQYYVDQHGLDAGRFVVAPPGVDERKFDRVVQPDTDSSSFDVLYWGGFHPHHGVDTLIRAASLIGGDIMIRLVGDGGERAGMESLADQLGAENVRFEGRVSDQKLTELIQTASVCVGVFSEHHLARRSITNKVCEALYMGKPVITQQSPVTSTWFSEAETAMLVPPEDPEALAECITKLSNDPALLEALSTNAEQLYARAFSPSALGATLVEQLENGR